MAGAKAWRVTADDRENDPVLGVRLTVSYREAGPHDRENDPVLGVRLTVEPPRPIGRTIRCSASG
jgi:hypothetical protein